MTPLQKAAKRRIALKGPGPPPPKGPKGKISRARRINEYPTRELYGKKTKRPGRDSRRSYTGPKYDRSDDVDYRHLPGEKAGRWYVNGKMRGTSKGENAPFKPIPRSKKKR